MSPDSTRLAIGWLKAHVAMLRARWSDELNDAYLDCMKPWADAPGLEAVQATVAKKEMPHTSDLQFAYQSFAPNADRKWPQKAWDHGSKSYVENGRRYHSARSSVAVGAMCEGVREAYERMKKPIPLHLGDALRAADAGRLTALQVLKVMEFGSPIPGVVIPREGDDPFADDPPEVRALVESFQGKAIPK